MDLFGVSGRDTNAEQYMHAFLKKENTFIENHIMNILRELLKSDVIIKDFNTRLYELMHDNQVKNNIWKKYKIEDVLRANTGEFRKQTAKILNDFLSLPATQTQMVNTLTSNADLNKTVVERVLGKTNVFDQISTIEARIKKLETRQPHV